MGPSPWGWYPAAYSSSPAAGDLEAASRIMWVTPRKADSQALTGGGPGVWPQGKPRCPGLVGRLPLLHGAWVVGLGCVPPSVEEGGPSAGLSPGALYLPETRPEAALQRGGVLRGGCPAEPCVSRRQHSG